MSQASSNWQNLKRVGILLQRLFSISYSLQQKLPSRSTPPKRKRSTSDKQSKDKKSRMMTQHHSQQDDDHTQVETGVAKPTTSILPTQVTGSKAEIGKYLAMDCEMVGVGVDGEESVLARVSIVNYHGAVIYDSFVRPVEKVTDFRTWVSGVTFSDVEKAPSFQSVQQHVADLIQGRVLIGHAISNDLKALLLTHPPLSIRDTAKFDQLHSVAKTKRPKLKALAKLVLGIDIQENEHSSVIDAQATMEIYKRYQSLWEGTLARQAKIMQAKKSGKRGGGSKKSTSSGNTKKKSTVNINADAPPAAADWWNESALTTA
ncbi:hypothetical protein E3P99_02908 [Wallemia hederae]|uniref:RNA exonuclease 4 n=1 Tax=Wallemia hederae TaxID=1540922 RepID=A0A4T0FHZ6_9BASI|nr:hypothetical protein E3P99_02908 [Wallemia hederae]